MSSVNVFVNKQTYNTERHPTLDDFKRTSMKRHNLTKKLTEKMLFLQQIYILFHFCRFIGILWFRDCVRIFGLVNRCVVITINNNNINSNACLQIYVLASSRILAPQ